MVREARWIKRSLPLLKIILLCLCAWCLPRLFVLYATPLVHSFSARPAFRLGLENISPELIQQLEGKRIGLITNQTGRDQYGQRNVDVLLEKGINITTLFAPEHGIDGTISASKKVHDGRDAATGIPIVSVYGHSTSRKIADKQIDNVDVIIFDIQDSGMRHYTYISILYEMMEAVGRSNRKLVVLDRPNPLGAVMEGPLVKPALKSFISRIPVPVRHGMTIGEIARYCNEHVLDAPIDLEVVPMKNYNRKRDVPQGLLASLSPNIKSIGSCRGYSFLGLLGEVDVVDVGVGSDKAFQCIMLPDSQQLSKRKWYELHVLLDKRGVDSKFYSRFNERKKAAYSGLLLSIRDINTFSGFNTLLTVIDFFKKAGIAPQFSKFFDKAMGTDVVQVFLNGNVPKTKLIQEVNAPLHKFFAKARSSFMYYPLPQVMEI